MELDLSAGSLIRSGSGLLFVALGLALLTTSRRREPRVWSFALLVIPFGVSFVLANLLIELETLTFALQLFFYAAVLVTIPYAAWHFGQGARLRTLGVSLIGALSVIVALAEYNGYRADSVSISHPLVTPLVVANVLGMGMILALPAFFVVCAWATTARRVPRLALASSAFSLYPSAAAGSDLLADASQLTAFTAPLFAAAVVGAVSVAWLIVVARGGGRTALVAALLPLATMLAGMVPYLWDDAVFTDWGLVGIVRVIAWSILVHAIVKADILDLGLAPRAIDRSALAAGALAALFIVAQIGQNLLSARYGLLMGGVAAGAFLFAASPLQRALEARRAPPPGPTSSPDASGASRVQEDRYRAALRLALRDRALTRDEEIDLHRLAEGLGLPAGRAHELLVEVERQQAIDATRPADAARVERGLSPKEGR